MNLHGFSFHVGTPCMELDAYCRGIKMCEKLIAIANEVGCENVQLIDIGGGFTGETEKMDKVILLNIYYLLTLISYYYLLSNICFMISL